MTLQLSPEQEQVVGQAIHAGLIRVPEDVLAVGIHTIQQRLSARPAADNPSDAEEWSRELHAFIQSHSTDTPVLTDEAMSRESIYESRGL